MSDDAPGSNHDKHAPSAGAAHADDPGRRRFLKIATCALGGGMGAVVAVPAVRYLLFPMGRKVVLSGGEPIDVCALDQLVVGAPPVRVPVIARSVRDAWSTVTDVPLGAAWLRRTADDKVEALSSICPHLGCAVALDAAGQAFQCPCHDSSFKIDGARESGPAERGLDPLAVEVVDGRVRVTWVQYRQGGTDREPV
jgi:Rieske Fe-S protein